MPVTGSANSLLVAGLVGAAVLSIVGCASSSAGTAATGHRSSGVLGTAPTRESESPYRLPHDPPWLLRIHTGSRPCAALGAAGSVWVADINDARVSKIDPSTGRVTDTIATAAGPCGMAYGAHSIWVEDYTANAVTQIMLPSLETRTYRVGGAPYDVAFEDGAAWTTNYADSTVTRIDAATGATRTIKVGLNPIGIAPTPGAVWVGDSSSGTVSRIDTATFEVTTLKSGGTPGWTAYSGNTVWVGDASGGRVMRIDAATRRIVARVKVGPTPNDGDVYQGALWVPDKTGLLLRIDPSTNAVTGRYHMPAGNPFVLSGYDDRLWVADYGGTDTFEIDPAKLPAVD